MRHELLKEDGYPLLKEDGYAILLEWISRLKRSMTFLPRRMFLPIGKRAELEQQIRPTYEEPKR